MHSNNELSFAVIPIHTLGFYLSVSGEKLILGKEISTTCDLS